MSKERWVCSLIVGGSQPAKAFFQVLTAFYDESGTHQGSPVTVIAGLAGLPVAWQEFEREWNKILRKYSLKFVHAKDLFHRAKQHKGWSDQKVRHLWADILYVIQEQEIFITKTMLVNADYEAFYRCRNEPIRRPLDSKYGLCFRLLLESLPALYTARHIDEVIHFVMEDGHVNAGDALRIYQQIKKRATPVSNAVGSLTFVGKEGYPAVQAADLLAYTIFRFETRNDEPTDDEGLYQGETEEELALGGLQIVEHLLDRDALIGYRREAIDARAKPNQRFAIFDTPAASPYYDLPSFEKRYRG